MNKLWLMAIILLVLNVTTFGATIYAIADVHHTDKPDRLYKEVLSGPRFYSESMDDLSTCVNAANADDADAIIELGDFVENTIDVSGQVNLTAIETVFANFNGPRHHVSGNWDIVNFKSPADFFALIENGEPNDTSTIDSFPVNDPKAYFPSGSASGQPISRYYAFNLPGQIKGLVLADTDTQSTWLDSYLSANSSFPIVVFIHAWLWPQISGYYNSVNADEIRQILETYGNVLAVFQGHHHPGAQGWWPDESYSLYNEGLRDPTGVFGKKHNGIKYYCLRSPVCGWGASQASTANKVGGDNEESFPDWTENVPANAYYKITIDEFYGREQYGIQVEGFGTNPGGLSDIISPADFDMDSDWDVDVDDLKIFSWHWLDNLSLSEPNEVAWWEFDQGEGSVAYDSSVYYRDGTLINDPNRVTGKYGSALAFDSDYDEYVEITGYQGVTGTRSRTCAAWIKTSDEGGAIISWGNDSAPGKWWVLRVNNTDSQGEALRLQNWGGRIIGTTIINDGQWHHVAAVFANDGTPDIEDVRLYVDGVEEIYSVVTSQPIDTADSENVRIGITYYQGDPWNKFNGTIDDVRIYDVALTEEMIEQLYQGQSPNGLVCLEEPEGDFNGDCIVSMPDLAVFTENWLWQVL